MGQDRIRDCDLQNSSMDYDIWTGEVEHGDPLTLTSRLRLGELFKSIFFSPKSRLAFISMSNFCLFGKCKPKSRMRLLTLKQVSKEYQTEHKLGDLFIETQLGKT